MYMPGPYSKRRLDWNDFNRKWTPYFRYSQFGSLTWQAYVEDCKDIIDKIILEKGEVKNNRRILTAISYLANIHIRKVKAYFFGKTCSQITKAKLELFLANARHIARMY